MALVKAMAQMKAITSSTTNPSNEDDIQSAIPKSEEDQTALLEWAYFEATTLVRQYGDLLEQIQSFLRTGTSTVGECSLLVESELT
jgi:hypothetical protein